MNVHKFGGTSLADAARIQAAAELVREAGGPSVVVVSAMAGVTDALAKMISEVTRREALDGLGLAELAERHRLAAGALAEGAELARAEESLSQVLEGLRDSLAELAGGSVTARDAGVHAVLAVGEDLSVRLMEIALQNAGLRPQLVDSRAVVRTEDPEGTIAVPRDDVAYELARVRLLPLLDEGRTPVLQGFVGATAAGITTTLGRGGSDFTAALVGAALGAREVTIWTDVDGVFSADPGIASEVRILPEIGFEEAVELAYFGARVIHPAAAKHAVARGVSLVVRNSLHPQRHGTRIRHDLREASGVAAVAHREGVILISVRCRPLFMAHGFLARVFQVLAGHGLPVDLVATSHTSTAFTLDRDEELESALKELGEFAEVEVTRGLAAVSVVGRGLLQRPGIVARVLELLDDVPVHLVSQASDVSLNLLVAEEFAPNVVRKIHGALRDQEGELSGRSGEAVHASLEGRVGG